MECIKCSVSNTSCKKCRQNSVSYQGAFQQTVFGFSSMAAPSFHMKCSCGHCLWTSCIHSITVTVFCRKQNIFIWMSDTTTVSQRFMAVVSMTEPFFRILEDLLGNKYLPTPVCAKFQSRRVAHLVEHLPVRPGTVLMLVWFLLHGKGFFCIHTVLLLWHDSTAVKTSNQKQNPQKH